MTEFRIGNTAFEAAEKELRRLGSNLWFGELTPEWQDYLVSNTVECFDSYAISMEEAASIAMSVFRTAVTYDVENKFRNPWELGIDIHEALSANVENG